MEEKIDNLFEIGITSKEGENKPSDNVFKKPYPKGKPPSKRACKEPNGLVVNSRNEAQEGNRSAIETSIRRSARKKKQVTIFEDNDDDDEWFYAIVNVFLLCSFSQI